MAITRLAVSLALVPVLALVACGNAASASGAAGAQPAASGKQSTLTRLLGRWERTPLEDLAFGDGGVVLSDGPGPLDLTGSYELLSDTRLSITWPNTKPQAYGMAFFGDSLRLTTEGRSDGDGWTLTRK